METQIKLYIADYIEMKNVKSQMFEINANYCRIIKLIRS